MVNPLLLATVLISLLASAGAVELGWSFPLFGKLKGYIQYFNGYGESLLDYNHHNERIGVGILLTELL